MTNTQVVMKKSKNHRSKIQYKNQKEKRQKHHLEKEQLSKIKNRKLRCKRSMWINKVIK